MRNRDGRDSHLPNSQPHRQTAHLPDMSLHYHDSPLVVNRSVSHLRGIDQTMSSMRSRGSHRRYKDPIAIASSQCENFVVTLGIFCLRMTKSRNQVAAWFRLRPEDLMNHPKPVGKGGFLSNILDLLPARKPSSPQRNSSNVSPYLIYYRPMRHLTILHIFNSLILTTFYR